MRTKYVINLILLLGEAIPPIKEFENILNKTLAEDGINEEYHTTGKLKIGNLEVNRKLTDLEIKQIGAIMHSQFLKLPKIGSSISSVELSLCKSCKSSSQSYNATNETKAQ